MAYQYTNDRPLHLGSMDVRVLPYGQAGTIADAVSIGLLDGVTFNLTGDKTVIETDNSADIDLGLANPQVEIGASAWKNLDLEVLYKMLGEVGTCTTIPGTATTVTDELVTLIANTGVALKNKNAAGTVVTAITAKKSDDTPLVQDTDYLVQLNTAGFTVIVPKGTLTTGDVIKVSYTYTPAASKKITYSSTAAPKYLHAWLINKNNDGKQFYIEVYRVSAMTSAQVSFGNDKNKTLISMPVSMTGKPDTTRPALDDLFSWVDEQVTV